MLRYLGAIASGGKAAINALTGGGKAADAFDEAEAIDKTQPTVVVASSAEAEPTHLGPHELDLTRYGFGRFCGKDWWSKPEVALGDLTVPLERNAKLNTLFKEAKGKSSFVLPPHSTLFTTSIAEPVLDKDGKPVMGKTAGGKDVPKLSPPKPAVHPDLVCFYENSSVVKQKLEQCAQFWEAVQGDITAFTSLLELAGTPQGGSDIIGALRKWKGKENFVKFVLAAEYHHLLPKFLGEALMQAVNEEINLPGCLVAMGYWGQVEEIYQHGNESGVDVDLILRMNMPCEHIDPRDLAVLQGLFPERELDIIMFTVNEDGTVAWSKCFRQYTAFLLSCIGAGKILDQRQLALLLRNRIEGLFSLLPRILDAKEVAKLLKEPGTSHDDSLVLARALLERCTQGGLSREDVDILSKAAFKALLDGLVHESKMDKTSEFITKLLKLIGHVSAQLEGYYSANTRFVVMTAFTGCSEKVSLTLDQILKHQVPNDREGVEELLKRLFAIVATLPLPKEAPPVVASPSEAKQNPELDDLFKALVEKTKESPFVVPHVDPLKIEEIKMAALKRNVELANQKLVDLQERIKSAAEKLKTAHERPHPLKQEIDKATAQLEKLSQEQDQAQAKLDEARAKLQAASVQGE